MGCRIRQGFSVVCDVQAGQEENVGYSEDGMAEERSLQNLIVFLLRNLFGQWLWPVSALDVPQAHRSKEGKVRGCQMHELWGSRPLWPPQSPLPLSSLKVKKEGQRAQWHHQDYALIAAEPFCGLERNSATSLEGEEDCCEG